MMVAAYLMPASLGAQVAGVLEKTAVEEPGRERVRSCARELADVLAHGRSVVEPVLDSGPRPAPAPAGAQHRLHAADASEPLGAMAGRRPEPSAQVARAVARLAHQP